LLDRAIRGELGVDDQAVLDRHLADCPVCLFELETARDFRASVAPGRQDETIFRTVIDGAMARLQQPETWGQKWRRWLGRDRVLRPMVGLSALGVAALVLIGFLLSHDQRATTVSPSPEGSPRSMVLEDGSEVTPTTAATALQLVEQSPTRTTVRLRSGSAEFRVRHDSQRVFRVEVGAMEIEDLGTVFNVAHEDADKIRVAVSEGRVAIHHRANPVRIELAAGESRVFESPSNPTAAPTSPNEAPRPVPPAVATSVGSTGAPRGRLADEPAALWRSADLARRSGNPQAAVAPLRRLVERYPKDPRTPSAAFTLGWVLLTELGRPREAAAAFTEAERHAPRGMLAEDAAARVAEAWQKAGDTRRAAQAARHYQRLYPAGRHMPLMRVLVGEP
jgi:transmembrane sensor